jgi:transcriptional regulator with AAA-type ATPase domain
VRERPRQVLLLDEVHRAGPEGLETLGRLMRDGQLAGAGGQVVSFRDTLVVMTSTTSPGAALPGPIAALSRVAEPVTFTPLTPAQSDLVAQIMKRRTP